MTKLFSIRTISWNWNNDQEKNTEWDFFISPFLQIILAINRCYSIKKSSSNGLFSQCFSGVFERKRWRQAKIEKQRWQEHKEKDLSQWQLSELSQVWNYESRIRSRSPPCGRNPSHEPSLLSPAIYINRKQNQDLEPAYGMQASTSRPRTPFPGPFQWFVW